MSIIKKTEEKDGRHFEVLQPMVPCVVFMLQLRAGALGKKKVSCELREGFISLP